MLQNSTISQSQQHLISESEKARRTYKMYLAVKLHFMSDSYDLTVNRGKIRFSKVKFDESNRESLYLKLGEKFETREELAQYLIANFAYGAWGNTDIVYGTSESDANYKEWIRRKQSMTNIFRTDLSKIRLHYERNNMMIVPDLDSKFPRVPELFRLFIGNHITVETLVMMDKFHPFLDQWKDNLGTLFQPELRRIIKVRPFVKFDATKIEPLFTEFMQEF